MELRNAVNTNRLAAAQTEYSWTDGQMVAGKDVKVRAVHFTELRTAIQGLWTAAGIGNIPEFTGGAIVASTRKIKAGDLIDLRYWLGQYEASTWAQTRRARALYIYDDYNGTDQFGKGRRTAMADVSGNYSYWYDKTGRQTKEQEKLDGFAYVTQYAYNLMDKPLRITYPDGELLTLAYGNHGLLTGISSDTGGTYFQAVSYNQILKPKSVSLGSSLATTFSYFGSNLDVSGLNYGALQKILSSKPGPSTIQDLRHTYDETGNLKTWQDYAVSPVEDFTYDYDDIDRLLDKKVTGGANVETFTYQPIGNSATKNGLSYTYGDSLRAHGVTAHNGVNYAYDNNGNMVTAGGWTYAYDKENRMVKATNSGVVVARFAYNADGKRVKRVDAYGTIHYPASHYEVSKGNGLDTTEKITKYYSASLGSMRRLIALRKSGTLFYILSDHLGSTTKTIDAATNLDIDLLRYTTYGETRQGGSTTPTDVRYTGQTLDSSTGLYWYASRPYNPALGRFTQPDTIVPDPNNPQALNRFSYALNNPMKFTDPTGHSPIVLGYDENGDAIYGDGGSEGTDDGTDGSSDSNSGVGWELTWDPSIPPVEITYTETIRDDFEVFTNIPDLNPFDLEGARPYFDYSYEQDVIGPVVGGGGATIMLDSDEIYAHGGAGLGLRGATVTAIVGITQSPGGFSGSGFLPVYPLPLIAGFGPAASVSVSGSGITGIGAGGGFGLGPALSGVYHFVKRLR